MKRGFLKRPGTASKPITSGAVITSKKTADDHSSDISSKPDRSLQEAFKIPATAIDEMSWKFDAGNQAAIR